MKVTALVSPCRVSGRGLSKYNPATLPLSRQRHRGRARTPDPFGQRGYLVCNPIIAPRTRQPRVEARRLLRMTTGAGRLDRRLGVRVDVAVAFVAFDATGFRYFFAVGDSVIGVIHRNAAAFIRCDRAIRPLVTVQTLLHHFPIGVLLLVSVVAFLAIRRVFRFCMVSVIESLDDAPSGMLSPLIAIFRIS